MRAREPRDRLARRSTAGFEFDRFMSALSRSCRPRRVAGERRIGHRQDVARLLRGGRRVQVAVDARQTLEHVVPVRLRGRGRGRVHALAFVVERWGAAR